MRPSIYFFLCWLLLAGAQACNAQVIRAAELDASASNASARMAATIRSRWPAGVISTVKKPGEWGYEEGVLLDGMAAEWHQTANGEDFAYLKAAVDRYVTADGTIRIDGKDAVFRSSEHTLDDVELGRAVLLVYRVTLEPRYYKAAKFLHDQLSTQPRTASGGYWHKQIYPNQMWLDGAYMAEPFRAAYAATFHQPDEFNDIAKQLLLMDAHMRDAKSGLLRHGWDESRAMPWANKQSGLSPSVWARADGWYAMALVDTLEWMPREHWKRPALIAALQRLMAASVKVQDPQTGMWWQVMDRGGDRLAQVQHKGQHAEVMPGPQNGNFVETSATAMFVYALSKGVRLGYLAPEPFEAAATRGWSRLQDHVKLLAGGLVSLSGTVKAAGLGGKPYRDGSFEYYVGEPTGDDDAKGVGAFLLAGSERAQAGDLARSKGLGKTVLLDAWFNSQTRTNAAGQTELFHYKWEDDANSGFSFFGRAFMRYGAQLAELRTRPEPASLARAQVYLIASPDTAGKNPTPHFMDDASAAAIESWVRAGGVLVLMENDKTNSEFEHFNTLSERFGIHFNPVLRNSVTGNHFEMGRLDVPADGVLFRAAHRAYTKEISTIRVSGPARAVYTDKGDVLIAIAKVGTGTVLAVTDPWLYNEYTDGRKLPPEYDNYGAAKEIAAWAIAQAK